MKQCKPFYPSILSVLMVFLIQPAQLKAGAPDYETTSRNLKEFQKQLAYLDFSVSNWIAMQNMPEGQVQKTAGEIEKHYEVLLQNYYQSSMNFMESDYNQSHLDLKKARTAMEHAYEKILDEYILETESLYKSVLPMAVSADDPDAKYFLRSGYKEFALAKKERLQGYNKWPVVSILRIRHYKESLRRIRISRRYLTLAMINANLPDSEKKTYQFISYQRMREGKPEYEKRQLESKKIRYLVETLIRRNLLKPIVELKLESGQRKIDILHLHEDNYSRPLNNAKSMRRMVTERVEKEGFDMSSIQPEGALYGEGNEGEGDEIHNETDNATQPSESDVQDE